jgi:hypothetical protein
MGETPRQAELETQHGEEPLKHDKSAERCQGLALELQCGEGMDFTTDLAAARLHGMNLLAV